MITLAISSLGFKLRNVFKETKGLHDVGDEFTVETEERAQFFEGKNRLKKAYAYRVEKETLEEQAEAEKHQFVVFSTPVTDPEEAERRVDACLNEPEEKPKARRTRKKKEE